MSKKSRRTWTSARDPKDQLIQRLMNAFSQELSGRRPIPKIGDHIEATFKVSSSGERYTVQADCIPDPGVLKYDPAKGKPFVLAISIFDQDGKRLK